MGRGNRSTRRKPTPVSICPSDILYDLIWDRTGSTALGCPQSYLYLIEYRHPSHRELFEITGLLVVILKSVFVLFLAWRFVSRHSWECYLNINHEIRNSNHRGRVISSSGSTSRPGDRLQESCALSFQANAETWPKIRLRPLNFTSFLIRYWAIILSLSAVQSALLRISINQS
jgi:hypothetical protein